VSVCRRTAIKFHLGEASLPRARGERALNRHRASLRADRTSAALNSSAGGAFPAVPPGRSRGEGSAVGAAGEIVIKPKTSDSAVVLTIREGKVVKASVRAKPEHMADSEPVTAAFAGTP